MDFGQRISITFKDFFVETYFLGCYSYVAVSNEMYNFTFLDIFLVKRVATNDGVLHWEFKFKELYSLLLVVF